MKIEDLAKKYDLKGSLIAFKQKVTNLLENIKLENNEQVVEEMDEETYNDKVKKGCIEYLKNIYVDNLGVDGNIYEGYDFLTCSTIKEIYSFIIQFEQHVNSVELSSEQTWQLCFDYERAIYRCLRTFIRRYCKERDIHCFVDNGGNPYVNGYLINLNSGINGIIKQIEKAQSKGMNVKKVISIEANDTLERAKEGVLSLYKKGSKIFRR